ncbi:MAG: DUF1801 domain-containing protein [Xanthomonadales bacterium]|nr:DUF1801 domain-containing protein [Gammaproteobacteria bacterium]MBT8074231.1 DUF1801 domain-containing protein [Gammaproteobacteria bacterium]MBT8076111.1 DUF1801 domain-containing protein [Gammaproteobacteria bacterium]NNK05083.1 DUF1801 domain-containing protein [Xanthomonadales bacterium]
MASNKTQPTRLKVSEFIAGIEDKRKRADCRELMKLMREITGNRATMWGSSIVGFGKYHYKYASGREGDFFLTGFAPRKQALTMYIISGFKGHAGLMKKLGKFKTGKSCLYVKTLDDIDRDVLKELVTESVAYMRETYPKA